MKPLQTYLLTSSFLSFSLEDKSAASVFCMKSKKIHFSLNASMRFKLTA